MKEPESNKTVLSPTLSLNRLCGPELVGNCSKKYYTDGSLKTNRCTSPGYNGILSLSCMSTAAQTDNANTAESSIEGLQ